jgi:hypothetical protein
MNRAEIGVFVYLPFTASTDYGEEGMKERGSPCTYILSKLLRGPK